MRGGNTNLNNGTGYGIAFKITSAGMFTKLADFNGTNGANCWANLVWAGDGNFYGVTVSGGINGEGNIFRLTTNGILSNLYSFTGGNDGSQPYGLTYANDGYLYGTTYSGGVQDLGTAFRVTTNGMLTTLHSFNFSEGTHPAAEMTLGNDGNFYGTTSSGSTNALINNGTVFKLIVPPAINAISASNRIPKMTVTGLIRPTVQIQATTNLGSPWSVLTNLNFTAGTNQFTDPSATNSPRKFYRAVVP